VETEEGGDLLFLDVVAVVVVVAVVAVVVVLARPSVCFLCVRLFLSDPSSLSEDEAFLFLEEGAFLFREEGLFLQ